MPSPVLPPELVARRRRSRRLYAVAVGVLVLAVALTMGVVIGTGEAANATLRTSTAAGPVPGGTVRPAPAVVWSTTDTAAGVAPLAEGTAITWSQHRLAGRDATTGEVRWSYTRADLSICDAVQRDDRAYVLFRKDGNCDEINTFNAQTGARDWFRTLSDDGEGRLQFSASGLLITYARSFHVIGASSGYDIYPPVAPTASGCVFTSVAPGSTGVLTAERCPDGGHLVLWSNTGSGDPAVSTRLWRVGLDEGSAAVAVGDRVAYAYDAAAGRLRAYAVADGSGRDDVTLDPATTGPAGTTLAAGNFLLADLGDRVYALAPDGTVAWSVPATGPATPVDALSRQVLVPTTTGSALVDVSDGTVVSRSTLPAGSSGERTVFAAGGGLLVAGPGLAYLR